MPRDEELREQYEDAKANIRTEVWLARWAGLRHCPNCDGEVVRWNEDLQADQCADCKESWSVDEQEATIP